MLTIQREETTEPLPSWSYNFMGRQISSGMILAVVAIIEMSTPKDRNVFLRSRE